MMGPLARSTVLCCVCWLTATAAAPESASATATTRRRLIGVIQAIPSVSWVAAHPKSVSALPFDGVAILADTPVPREKSRFQPREQSADFSFATMSNVSMNATALQEQLNQLKGLDLGGATENFLLVHANGAGTFSRFASGVVAANFRKLAAAAETAGLRGILFDPECYLKDAAASPCAGNPLLCAPRAAPSPASQRHPATLALAVVRHAWVPAARRHSPRAKL